MFNTVCTVRNRNGHEYPHTAYQLAYQNRNFLLYNYIDVLNDGRTVSKNTFFSLTLQFHQCDTVLYAFQWGSYLYLYL